MTNVSTQKISDIKSKKQAEGEKPPNYLEADLILNGCGTIIAYKMYKSLLLPLLLTEWYCHLQLMPKKMGFFLIATDVQNKPQSLISRA